VKNRKLAATIIGAPLSLVLVGVCLYFFWLVPVRTTTLVASSANWKAQVIVHVQRLEKHWHGNSSEELTVSWTGTTGEEIDAHYQLSGLDGTIAGGACSGLLSPQWTDTRGTSISDEEIKYGLFLTITWNGNAEILHLQKR